MERTQPPLPLRTGRAVRHTHDYRRHGIVDLYAALEIATGKVTHRFSPTHTAADFLRFMKKAVRARDLHVVLDNSSTHNTDQVRAWLAAHPRVQFHYTPTSASSLNQIEGFFGIHPPMNENKETNAEWLHQSKGVCHVHRQISYPPL